MKNRTTSRAVAGLAGLLMLAAGAAAAQEKEAGTESLAQQIEELKRGQQEIRSELAEIKKLLEAAPRGAAAQPRSPVEGRLFELGDNPVKGDSTARLTLVEFTDYQ